MSTETIFKIRDMKTGLFSTGGSDPKFDEKGKIWRNIGHIKTHLCQIGGGYQERKTPRSVYKDCEVVILEVNTEEADTYPVLELIEDKEKRDAKKAAARQAQKKQAQENRERSELARLKQKYD